MKHYKKLDMKSLLYSNYVYIDVNDYHADALFIQEEVNVKFVKEYEKEDSCYIIIYCKVLKKDERKFLRALENLEKKMLLLGYRDYSMRGEIILQAVKSEKNRIKIYDKWIQHKCIIGT